jgi:hypothetical protein
MAAKHKGVVAAALMGAAVLGAVGIWRSRE